MKKFKWIFIVLLSIGGLSSCSSDVVFEERKDFSEMKWMRFDVDTFRVNIKNIDDCYDLIFQCRFTSQINVDNTPVMVKMHAPSGQMRSFVYTLPIKNKNGNFEGDKIGDVYDSESKLRNNVFFNEPGEYIFSIQQMSSHYEIFDVLGIGLKVVKSKLDYSFIE